MLGTFITEWNVGSDLCAAAFASEASAEEVASKLASIAERYGFEGWLINIENTLEPANVQFMLHFLRCGSIQVIRSMQLRYLMNMTSCCTAQYISFNSLLINKHSSVQIQVSTSSLNLIKVTIPCSHLEAI